MAKFVATFALCLLVASQVSCLPTGCKSRGTYVGSRNKFVYDCKDRRMSHLPSGVPASIKELVMDNNALTSLTMENFTDLSMINSFSAINNSIKSVSVQTFSQLNIRNIYLSHNQISRFHLDSDTIQNLDLSYNNFTAPKDIKIVGDSAYFTSLVLDGNNFGELGYWAFMFNAEVGLKSLSLANCNIHRLKSISVIAADLITLSLRDNKLTEIPRNFFCFATKLTNLDLSNNLITTIHDQAFHKRHLDVMYLQNNRLTHFSPSAIQNLSSLTSINLSNNRLQGMDATEMKKLALKLPMIESINIKNNPISGFSVCALYTFVTAKHSWANVQVEKTKLDQCSANCQNARSDETTCDDTESCQGTFAEHTCIQTADVDVDECAAGSELCQANAHCVNTEGSYECVCDTGYSGDECQWRSNECVEGSGQCTGQSHCVVVDGAFTCQCNRGYSGPSCALYNHCLDNQCVVGNTRKCQNHHNGYSCICVEGVAKGSRCEISRAAEGVDVNECADGTAVCGANSHCVNTIGSHRCECDANYFGADCNKFDFCRNDLNNDCDSSNTKSCENRGDGYVCNCNRDANGTFCENNVCGRYVLKNTAQTTTYAEAQALCPNGIAQSYMLSSSCRLQEKFGTKFVWDKVGNSHEWNDAVDVTKPFFFSFSHDKVYAQGRYVKASAGAKYLAVCAVGALPK